MRKFDHLKSPEIVAKRNAAIRARYENPKLRKQMVERRLATMAKKRRSAAQKKLWADPAHKEMMLARLAVGRAEKKNGETMHTLPSPDVPAPAVQSDTRTDLLHRVVVLLEKADPRIINLLERILDGK